MTSLTEVLFRGDGLADPELAGATVVPQTGEGEDEADLKTPGARQSALVRMTSQESGGFLAWLATTLKCLLYSEQTMLQLAGPDAVQYLRQAGPTLVRDVLNRPDIIKTQ